MAILIGAAAGLLFLALLVCFPWLSIVLLLALPVLKASAEYYVPLFQRIDLTVAVCLIAGALGLWNLVRGGDDRARLAIPWKMVACLAVLAFALWLGLAWTSAPDYGLRKAYRFTGICIPYLVLPCFLIRSARDARRTIITIVIIGAVVALAVIVLPRTYLEQTLYGRGYLRTSVLGSNPIIAATIISLGLLYLLAGFVVPGSMSRLLRYTTMFLLPVGLFALLKTGTRSAVFGVLVAAAMLPLMAGRRAKLRGMMLLCVVVPVIIAAGVMYIEQAAPRIAERWTRMTDGGGQSELVEGRAYHYTFCLTNWWRKPLFGHGSGSFAADAFGKDEPAWPHNIVLEAMYETGLLGTVPLLVFLVLAARTAMRGLRLGATPATRLLAMAPTAGLVLLLMQSLTHADLDGARLFYLFTGVLYASVWQLQAIARRAEALDPSRVFSVGGRRVSYA